MMNRSLLKVSRRNGIGKTAVKKARAAGKVPGVLYGNNEPMAIELNRIEVSKVLRTFAVENVLVDLEIEEAGKTRKGMALVQDIQHHPINDTIEHVDFYEIDEKKKLHTEVPVMGHGEPIGVATGGGILDYVLRTLKVECLPKDLPAHIDVDIAGLELGKAIHVGEIKAPAGVTILNHKELPVFMVHEPKVAEAVTPVAGAAAEQVQPEVIKEKKVEEGDAKEGAKDSKKESKKDSK